MAAPLQMTLRSCPNRVCNTVPVNRIRPAAPFEANEWREMLRTGRRLTFKNRRQTDHT